MSEAVQFYCLTDPSDALARLAALRTAQPGHTVRFWQPGLAQPLPPGGFDGLSTNFRDGLAQVS